jgi:hypothetical protein
MKYLVEHGHDEYVGSHLKEPTVLQAPAPHTRSTMASMNSVVHRHRICDGQSPSCKP